MAEFSQGDKVKLKKRMPDAGGRRPVVLGQGSSPGGLFVKRDGYEIFISEEQVLQVSDNEDLMLGDMDAEPLPRIAATVVNRDDLNERFSKVE